MNENGITRKKFMTRISLGLAALSAVVASIPVVSALVAPLLERPKGEWRDVGPVADFAEGSTKLVTFINDDAESFAGVTARTAAWLRRKEPGGRVETSEFIAFAANCTHLGCPVRWEASAQLFMCPCHGGVYYRDGSVAAGPPPRALTQYRVRISNGQVQIQTAPLPITGISKTK
jgi:menaquinol-cytochrome c reductase iron-sulfur subunit